MSDNDKPKNHISQDNIQAHNQSDSYMRWLAFYYLGNREHSKKELYDKLTNKGCDHHKVCALLVEFEQSGYQSDDRMTSSLIKEGIRKKHGTIRILQTLKKHGLHTVSSADDIKTWIAEHSVFAELIVHDNTDNYQTDKADIDWLVQAVKVRVQKYGDTVPTNPKDKARQLRFLQYRGFEMSICFDALKYDLTTVYER